MSNKQRVVIQDSAGQDMRTKVVKATFTRPANNTQYTAGDVVGNSTAAPLTFSNVVGANGGAGIVMNAMISCSVNQSTKHNLRLYLFDGTSTVASAADNAAWPPTDGQMPYCMGHAEFSSWENGTGNCFSSHNALNLPFECLSSSKNLLGVLVERGTYTPVGADVYSVRLGLLRG